jgi:hypothetical protein
MKKTGLALVFLGWATAASAATSHFELAATFEPASKPGAPAAVSVTFSPTDPDVHINELPEPRLTLDPGQGILDDKQPPAKGGAVDPETVKKVDLTKPLRFAVALRAGAPRGEQTVNASVVYFYCSDREGWCRRGKTPVEFRVTVP